MNNDHPEKIIEEKFFSEYGTVTVLHRADWRGTVKIIVPEYGIPESHRADYISAEGRPGFLQISIPADLLKDLIYKYSNVVSMSGPPWI